MRSFFRLTPTLTTLVSALVAFNATAAVAATKTKAPVSLASQHLQALNLSAQGKMQKAVTLLSRLVEQAPTQEQKDRVLISLARVQYETGAFTNALKTYEKVGKHSASWLTAMEEAAWAEFRNGEPEKAIAKLKTVTSPVFKERIPSEPFFLMGLAQLRVCDFKALFATIKDFKERYTDKVKSLEKSQNAKEQAELKEIAATIQKLNLVEAEAIQLLYLDENGKKRAGSAPSIARDSEQLSFPDVEGDEVWIDEIDNFRVTLKGCVRADRLAQKDVKNKKEITR